MIGFQLRHTHTHAHTLAERSEAISLNQASGLFPSSPLVVVDSVAKARRVHDGQLELHSFLFNVHGVFDDLHRLVDTLCKALRGQKI